MDKLEIKIVNKGVNELPEYGTEFSAGFDFRADFTFHKNTSNFMGEGFSYDAEVGELKIFRNGGRVLIPTCLYMSIPDGYELQVRPRSGLALKSGISVANAPGTVDSDYRGEVGVMLINTSEHTFYVKQGDRIGQGVVNEVKQASWVSTETVEDLGETERGAGGFGHTGKN